MQTPHMKDAALCILATSHAIKALYNYVRKARNAQKPINVYNNIRNASLYNVGQLDTFKMFLFYYINIKAVLINQPIKICLNPSVIVTALSLHLFNSNE